MIDEKELRIGNWVYGQSNKLINDKTTPMQITIVTIQHRKNNLYDPIPLTPDILSRCGFDQALTHDVFKEWFLCFNTEMRLQIEVDRIKNEGAFICEHLKLPHIVHLHQLQNLFFSLTGRELEVNIK